MRPRGVFRRARGFFASMPIELKFVYSIGMITTIAMIAIQLVVVQRSYLLLYESFVYQCLSGARMAGMARDASERVRLVSSMKFIDGSVVVLVSADGRVLRVLGGGGDLAAVEKLVEKAAEVVDLRLGSTGSAASRTEGFWFLSRLPDGGMLVARLGYASIGKILWNTVEPLLWVSLVTVILSFFLAKALAEKILRPVSLFTEALRKMVMQGRIASEEDPIAGYEVDIEELGRWRDTFLLLIRQLREKQFYERILMHSEKMASVGRLAAAVAHEIRNPLASMSSLVQMMKDVRLTDEKREEYCTLVLSEIDRLDTAVNQLLDYARPLSVSFEAVDASSVVEDAVCLMGFEARKKGVVLEASFPAGRERECRVWADRGQLKQLLVNLVSNAVSAASSAGDGGHVRVELAREADEVVLRVRDDGPGIPPALVEAIFDPFISTKGEDGSGLGLAICSKIVERHGGTIGVSHTGPGGTVFEVRLPHHGIELGGDDGSEGSRGGR